MAFLKTHLEKIILIFLGLSFFIGIWHALPMLNIINDEMYYVGGVLRAMEHHTIIPAVDDVPYGTITYLLNYILIGVALICALPFFKFHISGLKMFLLQSPEWAYIIPRFLNACLALFLLLVFNKFFKKEIKDAKTRLFLLILLFTNMITALILHTGKMWVLSTVLVLLSFFYLHQSLAERSNRAIYSSVLFSFLALANFPLNLYSLISVPILFFYFRKDRKTCLVIAKAAVLGFLAFASIILFNYEGIRHQVFGISSDFHTIGAATRLNLVILGKSFCAYFIKLFKLFPLLLATLSLVSLTSKVRDRKLFVLSLIYFVVNFVTIAFVANGAYLGAMSKLRYLFHLGFFLTLIISSFEIKFNWKLYVIGTVSLVYYVFTIYFLAVPTTYNNAYGWIKNNYKDKDIVIVNRALGSQLQLPKNKESYQLIDEKYCATKCQNTVESNLNSDFKPLLIDEKSRETITGFEFAKNKNLYFVEDVATSSLNFQLVKFFGNPIDDASYYSVDYNMGNYFDLNYFRIKNLGSNIYLYKYKK